MAATILVHVALLAYAAAAATYLAWLVRPVRRLRYLLNGAGYIGDAFFSSRAFSCI